MSKLSDYEQWRKEFYSGDDAAWSCWKENQILADRIAALDAALKTVRMCESIEDARVVVDEILQA